MKNLAFLKPKTLNRNAKTSYLFLLFFLLNSCGNSSQDLNSEYLQNLNKTYTPQSGGTLIDAAIGEPSSLIYMVAGESAAGAISSNIFNKLLKYDKNLDLEGELAESWHVSNDQKTITFKLRPNLKWADGKPLTSNDVLWTWRAVIDEKTGSPYAR
jgi:peptide/nickel transport system substrate-binding protein